MRKRSIHTAMLAVVVVLILVGVVTACGEDTHEVRGSQDGAYSVVLVRYQGRTLSCVRMDTGTNNQDDSGLSCDFVAFYGLDKP